MPAPVDPAPDLVPHTLADADVIDARFAALYAALDGARAGLDAASMAAGYNPVVSPQQRMGMRFGTTTITIPNGASSGALVVAHGLGAVPAHVSLTPRTGATGSYLGTILLCTARDATNITVQGDNNGGYASGIVVSFDWAVWG
jgi:hypothetical protein